MSGRGRGRGRAPPTGARLLLQRSAQEAGLDAGNLRNLEDITKPKLFPDYEWHSSGRQGHEPGDPANPTASTSALPSPNTIAHNKRSASTVYLINKSREMHHRFQNSPYYVRPTQEVDVVRYGKRPRPMEPDVAVLEHVGKTADPRYIPEELLQKIGDNQLSMKEMAKNNAPKKTLEEMAAEELNRRQQAKDAAEEGDEDELSDSPEQEDDEEEEVADYTANHFSSDDESAGDVGGDEATF